MAAMVAWFSIFSVVLVAGAGPSINNGSTAIKMTHRSNHDNTTATTIITNSTVILSPSPAIIVSGNHTDTTSPTKEPATTTIYMQKDSILKVIIPSVISFAGVALMLFLWWSSLKAKLAGVDQLPPIASMIADPTSSAIAPIVELVNRSTQNQPPPPPPTPLATAGGETTKK